MNVLIIGSGGREHALYAKLSQSEAIENLYIAPGNAGVPAQYRLDIAPLDFSGIREAVHQHNVSLVVVGPEQPLAEGIKDYLQKETPNVKVVGPNQSGARLEASKVFSQKFMEEAGIPVGRGAVVSSLERAESALETFGSEVTNDWEKPIVIKVDGLAGGKGVSIHGNIDSAREQLRRIFEEDLFGEAGKTVLLQEFLSGTEASLFAICNGSDAVFLPTARDYKRLEDGDAGPNTGGMGSFCPGDSLNKEHIAFIRERIVQPVLDKFSYTGFLYIGLMVHSQKGNDLSMIEFNCRLGDPETQCVLPMTEPDLLPYLLWSAGEEASIARLRENRFDMVPQKPGCAVNVVLAAKGYPEKPIKGIELNLDIQLPENVHFIHAGTKMESDKLVSSGGRILNIVALGMTTTEARQKVYDTIEKLKEVNDFSNLHYRSDIAADAMVK